jgi:hypothetical protein
MSWRFAIALGVVILGAAVLWRMTGMGGAGLEPVRFATVQSDLFSAGGTLTDAWADIDGDRDPDRFVGFNDAPSRLYRNDRVEGFVDVASALGLIVERSVRTSAWGDFDSDGDPDLFLG